MTDHSSHSADAESAPGGSEPVGVTPSGVPVRREPTAAEFHEMVNSSLFQDLKKTFRRFTFPMSVAFFVWYIAYVVSAIYAPEFMAQPMWGMNVGIWFGLAQFLTTFIITAIYVVYANREIEPRSAAVREAMEG